LGKPQSTKGKLGIFQELASGLDMSAYDGRSVEMTKIKVQDKLATNSLQNRALSKVDLYPK
jgi:hypothetical protein